MRLAAEFKARREAAGYTQQQVADALGIDQTVVSAWERGKWLPRLATVVSLSELYGCEPNDLLKPK